MGVLVAHRLRRHQAVAEPRRERFNGGGQSRWLRPFQMVCNCIHVIPPRRGGPWQRKYKGSRDDGTNQRHHAREPPMTSTHDAVPQPFVSSVMRIEPAWIDYNGHLNMAYYNVLFDRAIDELWLESGSVRPT
jgi:hypothetical protein